MIWKKGIALRIARWRNLSSLEKNVDEHFKKEYKSLMNHHERTFMKNSGNKKMIKRKEREVENTRWNPCNDLDGATRRDNWESLELREKKDEHLKPRI